jgi:hypothetical protein
VLPAEVAFRFELCPLWIDEGVAVTEVGAARLALTTTDAVEALAHPVDPLVTVYEITAVPAVTPVTTPEEFTVAMPVEPLLHTPLAVAQLSVVVNWVQTVSVPVIAATVGKAFTVTDAVVLLAALHAPLVKTAL